MDDRSERRRQSEHRCRRHAEDQADPRHSRRRLAPDDPQPQAERERDAAQAGRQGRHHRDADTDEQQCANSPRHPAAPLGDQQQAERHGEIIAQHVGVVEGQRQPRIMAQRKRSEMDPAVVHERAVRRPQEGGEAENGDDRNGGGRGEPGHHHPPQHRLAGDQAGGDDSERHQVKQRRQLEGASPDIRRSEQGRGQARDIEDQGPIARLPCQSSLAEQGLGADGEQEHQENGVGEDDRVVERGLHDRERDDERQQQPLRNQCARR